LPQIEATSILLIDVVTAAQLCLRGRSSRIVGFDYVAGATSAGATRCTLSAKFVHLDLAQFRPDLSGRLHGAADGLLLGVLVEEQHDLAGRALPRIAILQPSGALAEHALATAASDLHGIVEHPAIPDLAGDAMALRWLEQQSSVG
jgi:hypothetical protein